MFAWPLAKTPAMPPIKVEGENAILHSMAVHFIPINIGMTRRLSCVMKMKKLGRN